MFMSFNVKGLANNKNGGYLDQDEEWIYYCNPLEKNMGIFKIKKDLSQRIKLFDNKVSNINVYDNWVFFSEKSTIYKMKKDGSERKKLISIDSEKSIYEMHVHNDWIYYTDDLPYGSLYKATIEGSGNVKLARNSPLYINVLDDCIYYAGEYSTGEHGIYKIDLDGDNTIKISNEDVESLNVYDDCLYFTNSVDRLGLYEMSKDGKTKKIISNEKVSYLNIIKNWIYYVNISDSNTLYKIRTDGTGKEKIHGDLCSNVLVFNDYIYFENIVHNKICRIDINSLNKIFL